MPEMHFRVRWPDGQETTHYSPSLVVRDHLRVGHSYPLPEFLQRIRDGLNVASERVRAKYGFACSRALDELAVIEGHAVPHGHMADASVHVLAFDPSE